MRKWTLHCAFWASMKAVWYSLCAKQAVLLFHWQTNCCSHGQICCLWLDLKLNLWLDTDWNPLNVEWCFPMLSQLADDGMQRPEYDRWQRNLSACLLMCVERKKERERERKSFQGKTFISHRTLVTDHWVSDLVKNIFHNLIGLSL